MSASLFTVKEHVIPCLHIREEIVTTSPDDPEWRMHVRQYIPLNNPTPQEGDLTIIGGHGNGFIKELYEPLWDDLVVALEKMDIRIRSIIIPDASVGTYSSTLNPSTVYDPVSHWDHSRDLLLMLSHPSLKPTILQPIIGIGHSIGASQLVMLSTFHPSLFTSLILLDPILVADHLTGFAEKLTSFALNRPNEWPSRKYAEGYFRKGFGSWDKRCLEKWMQYSLVPVKPDQPDGATKLAFARVQEVKSYVKTQHVFDSNLNSESVPQWVDQPFQVFQSIEHMCTRTLVICGVQSASARPAMKNDWAARMGSNRAFRMRDVERRVVIDTVEEAGHFVPFEKTSYCAERMAGWVGEELEQWRVRELEPKRRWRALGHEERERSAEVWMAGLKVGVKGKL